MNKELIQTELEKRLSLTGLPEETKEVIIVRLSNTILERSTLAIAESVSEDEAQAITLLQEQGKIEEVVDFISEKHPELDQKIIAITQEVIDEFLSA